MPLRIRRGTNAERLTITPIEGELIYTTDTKKLYVGDNVTTGGVDVTGTAKIAGPLSDDLDLAFNAITGTGNVSINGIISNGPLSLVSNSLRSSSGYIAPGSGKSIGIIQIGDENHLLQTTQKWADPVEPFSTEYGVTNGISSLINSKFSSRGTLTNPLIVQSGDALAWNKVWGHDGFDYIETSSIWQGVDPDATPSLGFIPGAIAFITEGINGQNIMGINSQGFVSINKFPAPAVAELDVNGSGVFSGTVSAGAFVGDIYSQDSTLMLDSATGSIRATDLAAINLFVTNFTALNLGNGTVSLVGNSISSNTKYVGAFSGNNIEVLELGDKENPLQLKRYFKESYDPIDTSYGITAGWSCLPVHRFASRGTLDTPEVLQSGDSISLQVNQGFDGTQFVVSSTIEFAADPELAITTGNVPGTIRFTTGGIGGPNPTTTLDGKGYFGVGSGTNSITEPLDVFGNGKIRGKLIVKQDAPYSDAITIYGLSFGQTSTSLSYRMSRGTVDAPETLQTGDTLSSVINYGYDGTDYVLSSATLYRHDSNVPITTGVVPGEIQFFTWGASGANPSSGFDAEGRFGVKNAGLPITEALEVSGNAQLHGKLIVKQNTSTTDALTVYGLSTGQTATAMSYYMSRGTVEAPEVLQSGDALSAVVNYGYDGSNYVLSSATVYNHDSTVPITTGNVPGKIQFFTWGSSGPNPSSGFDAYGHFGIKNAGLSISEALDVNGNAVIRGDGTNKSVVQLTGYNNKGGTGYHDFLSVTNTYSGATNPNKYFRLDQYGSFHLVDSDYTNTIWQVTNDGHTISKGYVQFGSFTTTERNALPTANGMVIYNTTDNKFQGYQNNGWINLDTGTAA